ncbi:MAG: hypothetical protein WC980_07890 [Candidatus Brocadiia bacterium]
MPFTTTKLQQNNKMDTNNPKEKESIKDTTEKYAESYATSKTEASDFPESGDFVSNLFRDKLAEQKELMSQALYLIDERQMLFKRNLKELENAITRTHNLEFSIPSPLMYEPPSLDSWKNKVTLEKTITDIETKKSAEYVRSWQDIAQLKKDLWPVISEYVRTKKKLEMIAGENSQDEIFNPHKKEPENRKETVIYILPRRIP